MEREIFKQEFEKASTIVDPVRLRFEEERSLDSEPLYIGKPGTRNLVISAEELVELNKEISKFLRGDGDILNIIQEMGDVYMALDYFKIICNISQDQINKAINVKLDRLKNTEGTYK